MEKRVADSENLAKTFKEFAYTVSHDLGTPLRAMVEFSRLLKAEDPTELAEESRLYLSMIIDNGEKAYAMLDGLLEYSRLNTVVMPLVPTNCNQLLHQCQVELADTIARQKAALSYELLPIVQADADQMKRLFLILLDNALLFHAPGITPTISISATQQDGEWLFVIRDNGIGIDPKFCDRIFQPFKRLHPEGEYPGIGMGLALAKKVMERHGGRIWVDSAPGEGSAFMFSIPEAKAAS